MVHTDLTHALCDDENNIVGGYISSTTKRAKDGTLKSESQVNFDSNGNPSTSDATNYAKDELTKTTLVHTDFTHALFDDENNIVGGYISTTTKRAKDGTLKSESQVNF